MIGRCGTFDWLASLRYNDHRDVATTNTKTPATAKIAAEVVLIPNDEQRGSFGERRRADNRRDSLLQEGITCRLSEFIGVAAAGSVLVIALIGNDVDKSRRRRRASKFDLELA